MIILFIIAKLFSIPLTILHSLLSWLKDNLVLLFIILLILSIPIYIPIAFCYLILYSILESFDYSEIGNLDNPEDYFKYD
jgi:hypothetical protein